MVSPSDADVPHAEPAEAETPSPAAPPADPARWQVQARTALTATAAGAAWLGGQLVRAWQAVDPDLRRHVAQTPLVVLTGLAPGQDRLRPMPDDGHAVLLFVHGLAGHPGNFAAMRAWFRWMGRSRSYSIAFDQRLDVEDMARTLTAWVAQVRAVNRLPDDAPVDLVAHSMGGLVCRQALLEPAFAAGVRRLVTLGTPHRGTVVARFAATRHTLALRPDSPLIQRLNVQIPWPGPPALPPLICHWSDADMLVMPHETAWIPGAQAVQMPGYSHYTWLLHPEAWQSVRDALRDPEPGR
jgi:pimeloyl-ACP methyl ester carboxylesterase